MLRALGLFVKERFALKATVPLTLVLFGAPAGLAGLDGFSAAAGLAATFLALLILRIVDDLSDMKIDAVTNPERGLVSGRIDAVRLKNGAFLCGLLVLFLNYTLPPFLTVSATAACYLAFYALKGKIPYVLQPMFVNIIFPVIPIYAGMLKGGNVGLPLVLMALFVWTAVIAHDYAHSVHGPEEGNDGIQSFSRSLGSRRSAALAALLFTCSSVAGFLFWRQSGLGLLFPAALVCTSALVAGKCVRLLRNPERHTASGFYISGFVFFLAPLAAVIVETALKAMGIMGVK